MSIGIQHNQNGMKKISVSCQVPENPFAKLAYYLKCAGACLDMKDELGDLTDYDRWFSLSEKMRLVMLVYLISSDKLIGKCWFPNEDMDSGNKFYELTRAQKSIIYTSSIRIGAQIRRVGNIMMFKRSWLDHYYIQPLVQIV